MSREIKFRAWYMPFGSKEPMQEMLHRRASSILSFAEMNSDAYIVEQFTGLKDVNGKEIYEGDIIKFFGANKKIKAKNEFGIIVYKADRYGAGFNSIIQNKEHGYGGINIAQDIVVGNVHENPELLEAQHDTRTD
ncbi:YopX family protein [Lentilactobacillus hilgardii]|uniref:YopX family protein n=1 Tax=Lentilactobacillus hilgardii TaxID=1588 RepID=UPI00390C956D